MDSAMVEEFFRAFCHECRADTAHQPALRKKRSSQAEGEAIFKAFAHALNNGGKSGRRRVLSSKGSL
jgi:imidazoleglycerol phosphate dehydratase HisB